MGAPSVYILDCTGGITSIMQNIILAVTDGNWDFITTNRPKMFISCATMFYDSIILVQHFVLYSNIKKDDVDAQYNGVEMSAASQFDGPFSATRGLVHLQFMR